MGPKCGLNRQDEGLKSDLGSSRGGQGVSEALNASSLKRFASLGACYFVLLHVVFVRKVLCIMAAASHCNCFSQCVEAWSRQRRRRGRRPHDVHVRCFGLYGPIHMIAAKSTTWGYLKRAGDNDLTLERASRSLAKTGSSWTLKTEKNQGVFEVFRCLGLSWSVLSL